MSSPLEVLTAAYGLLHDKGICRDSYATDGDGGVVSTFSERAERWCVVGAIARSSRDLSGRHASSDDVQAVCRILSPFVDENQVTGWNDTASDEEILGVLQASINAERSRIAETIHSLV